MREVSRSALLIMALVISASILSLPRAHAGSKVTSDWAYVEKRLVQSGFRRSFINEMKKTYEPNKFPEVLRLNVLLFLKKSDYHGPQVTSHAVKEVRSFMAENKASLQKAERENGVPANVVASLLWLESRHGRNQGHFHVPSVYLNLLQADRKAVQSFLHREAHRYADRVTAAQMREIDRRTQTKAKWALSELKSLEKIHRWKWKIGKALRGSFSGAFGMSQFLPSSYVKWARSQTPKAQPNLSAAADAIQSVAYYLKDHGWTDEARSHLPALMQYNNSRDYANAVLDLARKSAPDQDSPSLNRIPADIPGPVSGPVSGPVE